MYAVKNGVNERKIYIVIHGCMLYGYTPHNVVIGKLKKTTNYKNNTFLSQCNALEIQAAFPRESEQPQYAVLPIFFFFVFLVCNVYAFPHHLLRGLHFYDRWIWGI